MEFKDLLIIYLAAGAPFAAYYFFRHRRNSGHLMFWFELLFRFLVWFPYALLAVRHHLMRRLKRRAVQQRRAKVGALSALENEILKEFALTGRSQEFFEAREVIERYIALTNAKNNFAEETAAGENELFRIALRQNTELAARCLHRRNRRQVWQHQTQAQNDFYDLCVKRSENKQPSEKMRHIALDLTRLLNDQVLEEKINVLSNSTTSNAVPEKVSAYRLKAAR